MHTATATGSSTPAGLRPDEAELILFYDNNDKFASKVISENLSTGVIDDNPELDYVRNRKPGVSQQFSSLFVNKTENEQTSPREFTSPPKIPVNENNLP